jgi:hypothetical protein
MSSLLGRGIVESRMLSTKQYRNRAEKGPAMDIKPTDAPDMILTLEQLKEQTRNVMYFGGRGPSDAEWQLGNILCCVIDIIIDDKKKR